MGKLIVARLRLHPSINIVNTIDTGRDVVDIVDRACDEGLNFVMYMKKKGIGFIPDAHAYNYPIAAYGGPETYPFLSDPFGVIKGGIAVVNDKLVYSARAVPLHKAPDQHVYRRGTMFNQLYQVDADLTKLVQRFLDAGRTLYDAPDMRTYHKRDGYTVGKPITVEQITGIS